MEEERANRAAKMALSVTGYECVGNELYRLDMELIFWKELSLREGNMAFPLR